MQIKNEKKLRFEGIRCATSIAVNKQLTIFFLDYPFEQTKQLKLQIEQIVKF